MTRRPDCLWNSGSILEGSRENEPFKKMDHCLRWNKGVLCHRVYTTGIVPMLVRNPFIYGNTLGVSSLFLSEKREFNTYVYLAAIHTAGVSFVYTGSWVQLCIDRVWLICML